MHLDLKFTHNPQFFEEVDEPQELELKFPFMWSSHLKPVNGVDIDEEMKAVFNYEAIAYVNRAIIRQIASYITPFNVKYVPSVGNHHYEQAERIVLGECSDIIVSPDIMALIERCKESFDTDALSLYGVGLTYVGKVGHIRIYRDSFAVINYLIRLNWNRKPFVKIHIEDRGNNKFNMSMSKFDPQQFNPTMTVYHTDKRNVQVPHTWKKIKTNHAQTQ
jgi:hypothetical protein